MPLWQILSVKTDSSDMLERGLATCRSHLRTHLCTLVMGQWSAKDLDRYIPLLAAGLVLLLQRSRCVQVCAAWHDL